MNKKFLVSIAVFTLIAVGLLYFGGVYAYEKRYLWMPMSEEQLMQKASDFYYIEMNHESCELNNYKDFNSLEDCQNGIKCISDELSNIIPKKDLRRLVYEMKEGLFAESAVITYFEAHRDISQQYAQMGTEKCSKWLSSHNQ